MKIACSFLGYVLALYITIALAVSIAVASIVVLALYPFFLLYEQARKAVQAYRKGFRAFPRF
jgi:pilus assembly protein TadC